MKMSKRAETVLRASIKHWKVDVLKNGEEPDAENCDLCNTYQHRCRGCPIKKATGKAGCYGTVYYDYCFVRQCQYSMNTPEIKRIARKMIKFMKGLLP